MADKYLMMIGLLSHLISHHEEIIPSYDNLMEKWQQKVQEYKENKEFDNLATEYFGE